MALDEELEAAVSNVGSAAVTAVPSCLGVSIRISGSGAPIIVATSEFRAGAAIATSSLRLEIESTVDGGRHELVFFAANGRAFDSFAELDQVTFADHPTDALVASGEGPRLTLLRVDTDVPADGLAPTGGEAAELPAGEERPPEPTDRGTVDRAAGVLIGEGCTLDEAMAHLRAQGDSSGVGTVAVARGLLAAHRGRRPRHRRDDDAAGTGVEGRPTAPDRGPR